MGLSLSLFTGTVNAATVDFSFDSNPEVLLGDVFTLELSGDYLGDGNLFGGAIDLFYDSSVLSVTNVVINAPSDFSNSITSGDLTIDNATGSVSTVGFSSFFGIGSGVYSHASITFEAIGVGSSLLEIADSNDIVYNWANNSLEAFTLSGGGEVIVSNGAVVVPVPAAAWLLISGLGLIGFTARKNK